MRRFGDKVVVLYHDATDSATRVDHAELIEEIETRGLLYPVTVVDGVVLYDGAVSYPVIMRAVADKFAEREGTETA